MKRRIAICAEDTPAAAEATRWAVNEVYREGDVFHLIYVIKSMKPPLEIHHAAPGTSFTFAQPGDRTDATPKHVGDLILKCTDERDAVMIVLAAHNKPTERDRWAGEVGSVAAYVMKNCKRPLAIVHPKGL
ncbi:hypothetical protein Ndes2437B_g00780 [Nannochloris sp. 'desiccata']